MGRPYDALFERVFTRLDAEQAHRVGFGALRIGSRLVAHRFSIGDQGFESMGLKFPGRFGLAAGFSKNAEGIRALADLGFGFVEVGTVTGQPQPGNERPRLHRLVADRAIVNRMGFNNCGALAVAEHLRRDVEARGPYRVPVGINIGKTKVVPESDAISDYEFSTQHLAPLADYLVVNVSSPNTPGLRDLQAVGKLAPLLQAVREKADSCTADRVPLLVKIAPDLADDDIKAVAQMSSEVGLDGIIATNTTIKRVGLKSRAEHIEKVGPGGLSGAPLATRAEQVLRLLRAEVDAAMTLIGVGGISTPADAQRRIEAGADLVQGYTGLIYHGPSWPSDINRALALQQS